jgi:hypothetical protein
MLNGHLRPSPFAVSTVGRETGINESHRSLLSLARRGVYVGVCWGRGGALVPGDFCQVERPGLPTSEGSGSNCRPDVPRSSAWGGNSDRGRPGPAHWSPSGPRHGCSRGRQAKKVLVESRQFTPSTHALRPSKLVPRLSDYRALPPRTLARSSSLTSRSCPALQASAKLAPALATD